MRQKIEQNHIFCSQFTYQTLFNSKYDLKIFNNIARLPT